MIVKIPLPLWKSLPDPQKIEHLFERCAELERIVQAQEATIRHLYSRMQTIEDQVADKF